MSGKRATHFRIIGLRPLNPLQSSEVFFDWDRVQSIHKALIGQYEWIMFYKGITVEKYGEFIEVSKKAKKDYSIYDTDNLKISISAIVGKNGSGKSSIVELIIRTLNNLAASIFGEIYNYSSAEHLHFIDDVFAELLFQVETKYFILSVKGRKITLKKYSWESYYRLKLSSENLILNSTGLNNRDRNLRWNEENISILKEFFFTMVCNYSLYGFNYRDYPLEITPQTRLQQLNVEVENDLICEDASWLKGLFHKNDGYQTPIVLHPMRNDGQLDIVKENMLAKERMLSLLFYKDKDERYPMRTINVNLKVSHIKISLAKNKKFSRDRMLITLGISKKQNLYLNFVNIYNWIYGFWDEKFNLNKTTQRPHFQEACDYLVYKTLKIALTYKKYSSLKRELSKSKADYNSIFLELVPLVDDCSHITKKIRQTLNYLIAPRFSGYEESIFVDEFEKPNRNSGIDNDKPYMFLPPPIFDTDLILEKELGFEHEAGMILFEENSNAKVRKTKIGSLLEFSYSGLSSGEKQIAYTISNILYHMVNVDSEWDDYHESGDILTQVKYKYINLILDEVELYFHPEMQRNFLYLLLNAIGSVRFKHLKGVNILFATHSPFILSDIPVTNILRLSENCEDNIESESPIQTFGGNILDMLSSSFYMRSSIGEVARQEINKIISLMLRIKHQNGSISEIRAEYERNKYRFKYISSIIGDSLLKKMSENMITKIESELYQN